MVSSCRTSLVIMMDMKATVYPSTNLQYAYGYLFLAQDEILYEVNANSENWMIAGRKRGHVSLSTRQGTL